MRGPKYISSYFYTLGEVTHIHIHMQTSHTKASYSLRYTVLAAKVITKVFYPLYITNEMETLISKWVYCMGDKAF